MIRFFDKYEFPFFEPVTLGLLGISTSAYLTMKATSENNDGGSNTQSPVQNQKETLDAADIAESKLLNMIKTK